MEPRLYTGQNKSKILPSKLSDIAPIVLLLLGFWAKTP